MSLVTCMAYIEHIGAVLRTTTTLSTQKTWGQYLTPPEIAEFMAAMVDVPQTDRPIRILDPGAGAGTLGIAMAERLLVEGANSVELVAVELEPGALRVLEESMEIARNHFDDRFTGTVMNADVLDLADPQLGTEPLEPFDIVIANPPYFKMPPADKRGGGSPNIYTRFMEVSARLLKENGQLCFLIPRSFASGFYFRKFRLRFHASMSPERVHTFDSRRDAFREDGVLQENIVVLYRRSTEPTSHVSISSSNGIADLGDARELVVSTSEILAPDDGDSILYLPTTREDLAAMHRVQSWPNRLSDLGLEISTGPVIPFRAKEHLVDSDASTEPIAPLLWMQHVRTDTIEWPLTNGFRKPERIRRDAPDKLLVPNGTYVLLRRFSAREEEKRLTAAVLPSDLLPGDRIGIENHLNFVHSNGAGLDIDVAYGLAGLLNSSLLDRYFRISNGNTQVSATEMRALPLPSDASIRRIGAAVRENPDTDVDALLEEVLREAA